MRSQHLNDRAVRSPQRPSSDQLRRQRLLSLNHRLRVFVLVCLAGFVAGCGESSGGELSSEGSAAPSTAMTSSPMLVEGLVTGGRYVVMPPPEGWAECGTWVDDCPPESELARSLRVELTVPPGWEAQMGATVIAPPSGSTEGPDGAGLVIGWTTPTAGFYTDPCQPASHLEPQILVGSSVDDFVHAAISHPSLGVDESSEVELGGYRGSYLQLRAPSDISGCHDWRPFDPGIVAEGGDNLWKIWVIDVDGLRMIVLTEQFPGTPADITAELETMVESVRFVP